MTNEEWKTRMIRDAKITKMKDARRTLDTGGARGGHGGRERGGGDAAGSNQGDTTSYVKRWRKRGSRSGRAVNSEEQANG